MAPNAKILSLEQLADTIVRLKAEGKNVVHCHGVFDLLHIGHIRHFAQARELGDVLVVTLTPDRFVNKGPDRPAFTDTLRAEAIAALSMVDFVATNRWPSAVELLKLIKPSQYVKGSDYRDASKDVTGGIALEEEAVRSVGGKLVFTDDITFSSSNLINRHMTSLSEDARRFVDGCVAKHSADRIVSFLRDTEQLKVLVVGETIIDEYQYCEAIGKSSKEPTLAVKTMSKEVFAGGIIAVANHIAAFTKQVSLITMLGDRDSHEEFVRSKLHSDVAAQMLYRKDSPTILKRRLIDQYFFAKLMEIYEINDGPLSAEDDAAMCAVLEREVPQYDVVVVVDFGHSMLTAASRIILSTKAKFLAVNTQANAGNMGFHMISEYPRADYISLAEAEMRLEGRDRRSDLKPMIQELSRKLACPRIVVTRGSKGSLCYHASEGFTEVPAVATKVVDRVGAGDTFLALTALCAVRNAPMDVLGLIGNAAGAQAVATVGHRRYIERASMLKSLEVLLK